MAAVYPCGMTITEQLQFSVLTAPVATLDRRTLSQAWYSALYGCGRPAGGVKHGPAPSPALDAQEPPVHTSVTPAFKEFAKPLAPRANAVNLPGRAEGATAERRAPRSPLARKIERAFLRPRSAAHKASFTIEGDGGRVHVLLRTQGSQLKLIAICPPKARPHVAAALAQARYALALRGIDLDADARCQTPC